jgi:hypothetical protein
MGEFYAPKRLRCASTLSAVKAVPSWVYFSIVRLLVFVVPLVLLILVDIEWWVAALVAATIGVCVSYIFLSGPRAQLAADIDKMRHKSTAHDADELP